MTLEVSNRRSVLVYKVIKSIFGLHSNLWDSKVVDRGTFRSLWKAISSLYRDFHQLVSFKVGVGNKVRFGRIFGQLKTPWV